MKNALNEFSKEIWEHNYKGPHDSSIEDTWNRLSNGCASIEPIENRQQIIDDFYFALENFKFVPGGRIIANLGIAGRESTTLMNCFVHNPKDINYTDPDSIEGIYTMLKAQAHTLKSEGGIGINFSWIRPSGAYIKGISSRTPGVLKFMELWDKSSEIITAGSEKIVGKLEKGEKIKIRKGAQLAILNVDHPDIEDFIIAKQTPNRLTKFNMSVGITDDFLHAVENNLDWNLVFPDTAHPDYKKKWDGDLMAWKDLKYPIVIYKTIKAKKLWETIMYATFNRNEPGVLFLELSNKLNALSYAEKIFAGNPCNESIMATGVCNLGSLNLTQFIKTENEKIEFDFELYQKIIKIAIRFLDNINDISRVPLPEYKESMIQKRRVGLGNMGLGSVHFMLGIKFGSPESLEFIKKLYKLKSETELLASANLGKEKGSFPLFDAKKYFNTYWWKNLKIDPDIKTHIEAIGCMRNSHRSMNAPTGNTAIFAGCVSGGLEPVFAKDYTRWSIVTESVRRELRKKGFEFPDAFKSEWFETKDLKFSNRGNEQILEGQFDGIRYIIDRNRGLTKATQVTDYGWEFVNKFYTAEKIKEMEAANIFATVNDLSVDDHLNTLQIAAHYTDMSNSKTVNIPNNYSFEKFKDLYLKAWKMNIKGLTTYRAGTMTAVLETEKIASYQNDLEKQFVEAGNKVITQGLKLPKEYHSKGYILRDNNKKKWYTNVAFADASCKHPFALFVHSNNTEGNEVTETFIKHMEDLLIAKGISKTLIEQQIEKYQHQKNTTKIARIIGMGLRHNLKIIDIISVLDNFDAGVSSFIFHLKKLLTKFVPDGTKISHKKCPECSKTIIYTDGCKLCPNCSWSEC